MKQKRVTKNQHKVFKIPVGFVIPYFGDPKKIPAGWELMGEKMAKHQDALIRSILKAGSTKQYTGETRTEIDKPTLFKKLKEAIKKKRITLAERIGGDDLHEFCDW